MHSYTINENEDGSFSFKGKAEKITPEELETLKRLQPDSIWFAFVGIETYKRYLKDRQGNDSEFEN